MTTALDLEKALKTVSCAELVKLQKMYPDFNFE